MTSSMHSSMFNPLDPETHLRNLAAARTRGSRDSRRQLMQRDRGLPNTTRRVRFRRG